MDFIRPAVKHLPQLVRKPKTATIFCQNAVGYWHTPNGCWRYFRTAEVVGYNLRTGKIKGEKDMSTFWVLGYITLEYSDKNRSAVQKILTSAGCELDNEYNYMPLVSKTDGGENKTRLTINYNYDEQYNHSIFDWFSDLFENRGERTYSITGQLSYIGDEEGRICITNTNMTDRTLNEMADDASNFYLAKDIMQAHYKKLARVFRSTGSPEAKLRMDEAAFCLASLGFSKLAILDMYIEGTGNL